MYCSFGMVWKALEARCSNQDDVRGECLYIRFVPGAAVVFILLWRIALFKLFVKF